ncbi:unnamed protein product [Effrenium voratum]|nr:unnamed protein product [Effrenium voratum]
MVHKSDPVAYVISHPGQMLLAVNYIHLHGVHRDIKLENFLYEAKDSDHLKLIDFGFSKIWQPNTTMAVSCGTLAYVAPEVLEKSYTSQCDLWSLGVVAFVLLFGYMPFSGAESKQIRDIKEGNFTRKQVIWGKASQGAKDGSRMREGHQARGQTVSAFCSKTTFLFAPRAQVWQIPFCWRTMRCEQKACSLAKWSIGSCLRLM